MEIQSLRRPPFCIWDLNSLVWVWFSFLLSFPPSICAKSVIYPYLYLGTLATYVLYSFLFRSSSSCQNRPHICQKHAKFTSLNVINWVKRNGSAGRPKMNIGKEQIFLNFRRFIFLTLCGDWIYQHHKQLDPLRNRTENIMVESL